MEYNATFKKKPNTIQHFYNGDLLTDFQSVSMSQTQRDWKAESAASSTKHFVAITLAIIKLLAVNNAADSLQALPSRKHSVIVRHEVEAR